MTLGDLTPNDARVLAWFPADGTPKHRDEFAPAITGMAHLSAQSWIESGEDGWRLTSLGMEARALVVPAGHPMPGAPASAVDLSPRGARALLWLRADGRPRHRGDGEGWHPSTHDLRELRTWGLATWCGEGWHITRAGYDLRLALSETPA